MNNDELKQCGFTQTYYAKVTKSKGEWEELEDRTFNNVINRIGQTPKGVRPQAIIEAFEKEDGIWIAEETGYYWFWDVNTNKYIPGQPYQAVGIADGSITPSKTDFVKYEGVNVLDNNALVENQIWERQYGDPSTIFLKPNNGAFSSPTPILLLGGKKYFTTATHNNNTILLVGTWNSDNNSYTGEYYRANACPFVTLVPDKVDGYSKLIIEPQADTYLFFSSTTLNDIGTKTGSMVYEGTSLPESHKQFNIYNNLKIDGLNITDNLEDNSIGNTKLIDKSITPEKTDFVTYDGENILDNSKIVEGKLWDRQYGNPSTIYLKDNAGGFVSPEPIQLKANTKYFTTKVQANNVILLVGSWNEQDNSYVGDYYRANNCPFVTFNETQSGYGTLEINPAQDCLIFFSSTSLLDIGNPATAMIYEGSSLPSEHKDFGDYVGVEIKNLIVPTGDMLIVGKGNSVAKYRTIQGACNSAKDGDTILILPGTYDEKIICIDKEIHLVGLNKESTIITLHTNTYQKMPLSIAYGSISNLTVHCIKDEGAVQEPGQTLPYALHIDYNSQLNKKLNVDNCIFINDWQASVGIGLKGGFVLTFKNCSFISNADTTNGAVFFHDNAIPGFNGNSKIVFINCIMKSNGTIAIMPTSYGDTTNRTDMTFYNTIIYSKLGGKTNASVGVGRAVIGDGWRQYNNFFLTPDSFGNNIDLFNVK